MTIDLRSFEFDHVFYDGPVDVLYLHKAGPHGCRLRRVA